MQTKVIKENGMLVVILTVWALVSQYPIIFGGTSLNPEFYVAHLTAYSPSLRPFIDSANGYLWQSLNRFAQESLSGSQSLWWDPYVGLGVPFAQSLQPGIFYPVSLVVHALHWETSGVDVTNLINMVLAGLGMWHLGNRLGFSKPGRYLVAGLFMLSGSFVWFQSLTSNETAWIPWMLWAVLTLMDPAIKPTLGRVCLLALIVVLLAVGGFPDIPFLGVVWLVVPLGLVMALRTRGGYRRLFYVTEGFAVGGLVSMVLVLPFLRMLPLSLLWNWPGTGMIHLPWRTDLLWLSPYVFGHWFHTPLTISNWYAVGGYLGAVAMMLGVVGGITAIRRRHPLFMMVAVLGILGVMQINGIPPVSWVGRLPLFTLLPLTRLDIIVVAVLNVMLAGYGFTEGRRVEWLLGTCVVDIAFIGLVLINLTAIHAVGTLALHSVELTAGILAVITVSAYWTSVPRRRLFIGLLALLELVAWSNVNFRHLPLAQPIRTPTYIRFLQRHLHGTRVLSLDNLLRPAYSADYHIRDITVESASIPRRYAQFIRDEMDSTAPLPAFLGLSSPTAIPAVEAALHLVGVKYVLAPSGYVPPSLLPVVYVDKAARVTVYRVPGHLQNLVWWPQHAKSGSHMPSRLMLNTTAEIPKNAQSTFKGSAKTQTIRTGNAYVRLTITTVHPRLLVLRDLYYPGWQATINGHRVPIIPVDGLLQGIMVPSGQSTVQFFYRPPGLTTGWVLASLAVLWLILRAIQERQRRVRKQSLLSGSAPTMKESTAP